MTADLAARLQSALGDDYRIERELAAGGMSRVFLAEDKSLGRKVVVKVLPPELAADISTERFAREIKVSARLQHPQIVPLLSAGVADGLPYYVMPYVDGEGLRERIALAGKLSVRDVVSVLRDVAKALAFAHVKGVVHRDIKPENILLTGDSAVVADFGIAKAVRVARTREGSAEASTLTSVGSIVGTPAYMAPEQAAGDPSSDERADIYSFGCVGYEMLSGHAPFERESVHRVVAAHIGEKPKSVSELRPDCPRALATLIMRCLEKDPARRPQSASELVTALDGFSITQSGNFRAFTGGRRIPIALAAALMLALGVFVVNRFRRGSRPSPAIAVLPFKSIGGDTTGAYFGQGIAEDLALSLRKIPGLEVASQTSSQSVQQKGMGIREIGNALGVGSVIEGTIQRHGTQIRVDATLSDVTNGKVMWSDAFDRESKDLFQVQDELVQSIVRALQLRLTDAARPRSIRGTADPLAYDYYLRGRYTITKPASVNYFEEAIARDSKFARAYSGYADALSLLPFFAGASFDSVTPLMFPPARRAVALDPSLGEAHASLARAFSYTQYRDSAELEYRIAIKLDPTYANARQWFGSLLCGEGRLAECLVHSQRATELDPMNVAFAGSYANSLMLLGRNAEAEAALKHAIQLDSAVVLSPTFRQTMLDLRHFEDVVKIGETYRRPFVEVAYAYAKLGMRAKADSVIALGSAQTAGRGRYTIADQVVASIGIGDTAKAVDFLDQLKGRLSSLIVRSQSDPLLDPIRNTPQYAAFVTRMHMDPKVLAAAKGGRPQ